jgi:hypothetical protein
MLRLFSSMKAVGLFAVLGSYSAQACDQVNAKPTPSPSPKPAIVSTVVFRVIETGTLPAPLAQAAQKTADHVKSCHDEVSAQQEIVDKIKLSRTQTEEARELSVSILRELREFLSMPGCSVCIDGKLYSKETIAGVIEKKLGLFAEQSTMLGSVEVELKTAQSKLDQLVAKAQRWEAAEKLLLSELDRVLNAKADLAKQALAEQEALQLADAITAKIARVKAEAKTATQTESAIVRPISSVKVVVPAVVSKAIAEFEAIFGK